MELSTFLSWLIYGGGSIMATSWILERSKWFQGLESQMKEWVFFFIAVSLSVAAYAFNLYAPAQLVEQLTPIFAIVASIFYAVMLGKGFHLVDKK